MNMMKRSKAADAKALLGRKKSRGTGNWMKAIELVNCRGQVDPWEKFHLNELPVEKATRHRYDALAKRWFEDQVYVRLDSVPFDQGAMRECFRM